jgi:hypothetical protein
MDEHPNQQAPILGYPAQPRAPVVSPSWFLLTPKVMSIKQPLLASTPAFAYDYSHLDADGNLGPFAGACLGCVRGKTS